MWLILCPGGLASNVCCGGQFLGPRYQPDFDNCEDTVGTECRRQPAESGCRRSPSRDTVRRVDDATTCCGSAAAATATTTTGLI